MRKGGLHKPLILDKFSAEELDAGAMGTKTHSAKPGTCQYVLNRPDSSRDPAGQILSTRCEGKSSKEAENFNAASDNETVKGV